MAQKFSITGQINLTAPSNLRDIAKNIKDTLSKTKISIDNVSVSPAAIRKLVTDIRRAVANNVSVNLDVRASSTDVRRLIGNVQSQINSKPIKINVVAGNAQQVASDIEKLLQAKLIPINLKVNNVKSLNEASKSSDALSSSLTDSAEAMENLGKQTANTIRRFGIYTVATAIFFELSSSIKQGVKDAVDFEAQMIKIRQVTGESIFSLQKLNQTVTTLATGFGVSSSELLESAQVLSQAGFTANQVNTALTTLAKADLSPTFNSFTEATEGAIAALNQFDLGVENLESTFDSLNTVAAKFAVESDDLITAIRTAGGAFAAAGGDVNELQALFTSIRQTTRASASSIAVGLKTISTRLQRGRTQNFLRDLGIDLRFAGDEARKLGKEGLFVGVFESIRRISEALSGVPTSDPRFAQIAEELGGFRQIDKVIPLLTEFALAERVRGEAIRSTGSLTRDATIAQESLANQLTKVREEFSALIREFTQSDGFKLVTGTVLNLIKALIELARTFKDVLLPLAGAGFLALSPSLQTLSGSIKTNLFQGRFPFAEGGRVPGIGNKDTVPAMLTPGEFVIKKEAASILGRDRLNLLNQGKIPGFNKGGLVGVQSFNKGGPVNTSNALLLGGGALLGIQALQSNFDILGETVQEIASIIGGAGVQFLLFKNLLDVANPSIREAATQYEESNRAIEGFLDEIIITRDAASGKRSSVTSPSVQDVQESIKELQDAAFRRDKAIVNNDPQALLQAAQDIQSGRNRLSALQQQRRLANVEKAKISQEEAKTVETLVDRIKTEEALSQESVRLGKQLKTLNTIVSGVGLSLQAFSQFFENFAQRQLESLRSGERINEGGARASAVAGGALGTGSLAAIGSVVGIPVAVSKLSTIIPALSALGGPVALGVTTGLITLGGALVGAYRSAQEFDKELRSIQIEKLGSDLSSLLSTVSDGSSSVRIQSGDFTRVVNDIRGRLRTETDSQNRTDINALINNNIQGIQDFIDAAKSVSSTLEEFDGIVPVDFLEFFARRTGQSFSELRSSIAKSINIENTRNNQLAKQIANVQAFETRIRTEIALSNAIKGTVSGLTTLNSTIKNINDGSFGTDQSNNLSSNLTSLGSIQDVNSFTKQLTDFANSFGPAANDLISDTVDSAKALQVLPSILLQIRRSNPFSNSGDLLTNLGDQLNTLGFSKNVRDVILSQLAEIGGPNQDDSRIIDAITNDLSNVLTQVSNALEGAGSSLKEANNSILSELGNFANGLQTVNESIVAAGTRRFNAIGLSTSLGNIINRTPNFGQQQNTLNQQQELVTGGRSSGRLLQDLVNSQQRLIALNKQIENTTDIEARKQLIQAQAQQALRIKQVNTALDFMSDATRRASVLEAQLNKERSDRANRASFAENIAFGTQDSNNALVRNVAFAREAARSGNLSAVPEQFRQELLSFLKQIGDTQFGGLGGLTGQDIIDRIVRNNLGAANVGTGGILDPSAQEQSTVEQIRKIFQEAQTIENQRANLELQNSQFFLNSLNNSFKSFLQNLRQTIVTGRRASIDENILAREGDLAQAQSLQQTGQRLQELSGVDPSVLRNSFDEILRANEVIKRLASSVSQFASDEAENGGLISVLTKELAKSGRGKDIVTLGGDRESSNRIIESTLSIISSRYGDDIAKQVRDTFNEGGGRAIVTNGAGLSPAFGGNLTLSVLTETLESVLGKAVNDFSESSSALSKIEKDVGGQENVGRILDNREEISRLISTLPDKVNFSALNSQIQSLTNEIRILRQTRAGFNSGGMVPGTGSSDTVPAMLTPGEFVIKKSAVERIGVANLSKINSGLPVQKLNSGGLVQQVGISSLNNSVSSFLSGINRIVDGLRNIPSQIEMTGNHRVEVVINGGQALATMLPSISSLVKSEINRSINKLINERFPEQGPFNA